MNKYSQEGLRCTLSTDLGDDVLIPVRFQAREELSSLYEIKVDAISHDSEIGFESIVGTEATVTLLHEDEPQRHFSGIVSTFAQSGTHKTSEGDVVVYRMVIVPWFWLLTLDADCRVFAEQNVKEIVENVFKRRAAHHEFSLDLLSQYAEKPYSVQYRERDFDFVSRLLEQEGISYCFEHSEGGHKLVLFDDSTVLPNCAADGELVYGSADATGREQNEISDWVVQRRMNSGRYAVSGYDFENPSDDNEYSAASLVGLGGNANREIFDCPSHYTSEDGSRYAAVRMEELETESFKIIGSGACMSLVPGKHVTLTGHYRPEFNGARYLLTGVEHKLEQTPGNEGTTTYSNTFYCLPTDIKYRPRRRTQKPRIEGSQTALVVGPSTDEIHCDELGRVRIQFHWDRYGASDGSNVCLARTSQSLAGTGWGSLHTPRIGQEVVVSFIEGDPDRPIVTGVVYNGDNQPPFPLPANKTRSGIKTRSSSGGTRENYNEISLEDKKGAEEILIHAERDMNMSVEANHNTSVGCESALTVTGNRTETVKESRTTKIEKDDTITVATGQRIVTVENGLAQITAKTAASLVCNEGQALLYSETKGAKVAAKTQIDLMSDGYIEAKAETFFRAQTDSEHTIQILGDCILIGSKGSSVLIGDDKILATRGGSSINISDDAVTAAKGGSKVKLDDSGVQVTGGVIKLNC